VEPVSVDSQDPVAKEAASLARELVKARIDEDMDRFGELSRAVGEHGIGVVEESLDSDSANDRAAKVERAKWQSAFTLALSMIASAAVTMAVPSGDSEERKRFGARLLETLAESDLTI
jgi:hypothetical protein